MVKHPPAYNLGLFLKKEKMLKYATEFSENAYLCHYR